MQRRTFEVSDIHCERCEGTIRAVLSDMDGIRDLDIERDADRVTVAFDEDRIGHQRIAQALADAGFPARPVDDHGRDEGSATIPALREGGIVEVPLDTGASSDAGRETGREPGRERSGAAGRYGLLIAAVLVIALAGYLGYVLYPRFDLPAAQGAGLLGLAAAAGIASFFSPCSFPLLLSLLGRRATQTERGTGPRPAVFGGALALGAAVFMLLAGVVIGLGGEALFADVTFTSTVGIAIRIVVGLLLIVLGLIQTNRLPLSLHAVEKLARPITRRQARMRREHPVAGYGLFGFGYVFAGFG